MPALLVGLLAVALLACVSRRSRRAACPCPASGAVAEAPALAPTQALSTMTLHRHLFELPGHAHFFVAYRIVNRSAKPLGIDLRDYWKGPRPNQWGGQDGPTRGGIDESRIEIAPLDDARRGALRAAFEAGKLDVIPPGAHLDVHVEFNASGRADVDAEDMRYLFVSLDGFLDVTDGARVERHSLAFDHETGAETPLNTLILPTPVVWKSIPPDARVVHSP